MPDTRQILETQRLEDALQARGVSRRDFLKFCGSIAAMLGLEASAVPQIAAALTRAGQLKPAVWLEAGSCSGCTESVAQADNPSIVEIVLDLISLNYTETIMAGAGHSAEKALHDTVEAGGYILIYEGSVMEGWDGNALVIAGRKGTEELLETAEKAEAVIAVGSCAVDGGWVAAHPNPAEATGVQSFLTKNGVKTPVINLPTCPVNPEWVVAVVVDYLMLERVPELDDFGRPKLIFGQTIHDNCPRRGHFENGEFVYEFGSEEEAKGYCLYAVGCKGPQTYTNCPVVRWNRRASWCVEAGAPCIGCGGFNWVDQNAPFLNRFRKVDIGGSNMNPGVIAPIAAGVVAGALAVHGLGMKAAGRVGSGAPTEEMKDHDRKRAGKGGGN